MPKQENIRLYNGEIELVYKETAKGHSYWVNGRRVPGCTTCLSIISKPALMYWSVNQAIDYLKNNWSPGQAYDELEIEAHLEAARTAHIKVKDKAATKGSLVHEWIHRYIIYKIDAADGRTASAKPELPKNAELAQRCTQLLEWLDSKNFIPTDTEYKIFSRKHWIAGTVDIKGTMNNKPVIVDIKNSSGIWPEYKLQVACYASVDFEMNNVDIPSVVIIRISDDLEIEELEIPKAEYREAFAAFINAKHLYEYMQSIKK